MGSVHTDVPDDEQSFHYQPLANPGSSTRLVEIDPDTSSNGSIQIRLFESPLTEDYTCLSYVWGPETDQHFPIIVNGEILSVRRNLHDFLCIARKKYPRRKLWIDAICINQADTNERNHQVQQMGEIYLGAREVIAWLGDPQGATWLITRINSKIRHFVKLLPADILMHPFYGLIYFLPYRLFKPIHYFTASRSHLLIAITRYWERAWVTQEVTLAKHVRLLISDTELELTALTPANLRYLQSSKLEEHSLVQIHTAHTQYHNSHEQYLVKLLSDYRFKMCAVERDRIFSLLAICAEKEDLKVDYNLSEEKLISNVLRSSRLTPCLCSAHVVSRGIDVDAIPERNPRSQYFVKFTVQATDVHTYQAKKRKLPSCCSAFSNRPCTEQADGQVFCLQNICPLMKWHLLLVSDGPEKHSVKEITSDRADGRWIGASLGENGRLVNIYPFPQGDSYTIKIDFKAFLELPKNTVILKRTRSYPLWTQSKYRFEPQTLCDIAQRIGSHHNVEYLDLEAKDEASVEEDFP